MSKLQQIRRFSSRSSPKAYTRPTKLRAQQSLFKQTEMYKFDFTEQNPADFTNANKQAYEREFVIPYVNNRHFASEALLMSDRQIRNRVRHLVEKQHATPRPHQSDSSVDRGNYQRQ